MADWKTNLPRNIAHRYREEEAAATGLTLQEEGVTVGTAAGITTINFVGAGATATAVGATATVTTNTAGVTIGLTGSTNLINASSATGTATTASQLYTTGVTYGKLSVVTLNGNIETNGVGAYSVTWASLLPPLAAVTPIATCEITGLAPGGGQLPGAVTLATDGTVSIGLASSLGADTYRFHTTFAVALV